MIKLCVTDLDDTLYSWIGFFIPAFYSMVDELSAITGVDEAELLREYKSVHQESGSVEYPYAALLLPSVLKKFPGRTQEQLKAVLDPAFHRFNAIRKQELHLFPFVQETLAQLNERRISIVGYTESAEENGFYRLKKLGIADFFSKLYVSDSQFTRPDGVEAPSIISTVQGKKPNPSLLLQILQNEHAAPEEAVYVGDSLTKDVYMAKKAGVPAILCKYPPRQDAAELYEKLNAISSWTESEFQREAELKRECTRENIQPDYTIHSFAEILTIIDQLSGGRFDG